MPDGSFRMIGAYDPYARRMVLSGDSWVDRPDDYLMVGLEARMPAGETPMSLEGDIVSDNGACTTFTVLRRP
ncbi:hypothetical protein [Streptomyces omiyaensis]|uniref:Lipocalin-like domain-containing protein n=1 Tax=Streptomyces omiyaensis TaxID=68247 RepID=A0ABW7BRS0_9ACTN|nr:hypothetical protein [Streptomyces omiyaensis]GGY49294.1 hypothetical protein GCM10010363_32790 [Streptomyces omiyaensis]